MKAYVVGGAVRDRLLGLQVKDRDWVVVGATPEAMVGAGFRPVGRDFPVFLHPTTNEEYALARTERKSGRGYHGFVFHASPEVSLADDLARRDLTINAIAEDPGSGELIDPFDGRGDLQRKLLRHVSPAFAEDPVRLLRCARFAARFADFAVAPETMALMRRLVDAGEVDALVPERVWQELARGLMEARPDRMLQVLRDCGALARLLPEVDALFARGDDARLARRLHAAAAAQAALPLRYAALCLDLDPGGGDDPAHRVARAAAVAERWRVDGDSRALAAMAAREHRIVHRGAELDTAAVMALFERCDAWRRPQRFADLLRVCEFDARAGGRPDADYPPRRRLGAALDAALEADAGAASAAAIAAGLQGRAIGERVRAAQAAAVTAAIGG